ncbi:glycosyltransferase family 4 protein [Micrococcales bacterium 31B]|nr:glycosyltransferase family 4 protein [Micrococcales bacterium 31B]
MSRVALIVPAGIADPRRPSGGNVYDLRIAAELAARGHDVTRHDVAGAWPHPQPTDRARLRASLLCCPDGGAVIVDGLVGAAAGEVLLEQSDRLALTLLVHMPLEPAHTASETAALRDATRVVVTSAWSRELLLERYPWLVRSTISVIRPGVDAAPPVRPSPGGARLLTVGAVTSLKGQDLIAAALARCTDLGWTWEVVGAPDIEPEYVTELRAACERAGMAERVRIRGALAGAKLHAAYDKADLLVVASRFETYGMVVGEALARGIPVLAPRLGGLPEALGTVASGQTPGTLVRPASTAALAGALRDWLTRASLRTELRERAMARRETLTPWSAVGAQWEQAVAEPLAGVA